MPNVALLLSLAALGAVLTSPAAAWCVRNDGGRALQVAGTAGGVAFEVAHGRTGCCDPGRDDRCATGSDPVRLDLAAADDPAAACSVAVPPRGHVNVTRAGDGIRCKALEPGSTMDWGR